jgi:hypothetical protein
MVTDLDQRIANGDVPESLRGVLLDFPWELDRLFALDLPTEAVSLSGLLWLLDLPFWREGGEWFAITPNQVREHPHDHEEEWNRVQRVDLSQPIHIAERDTGWVVIDGIHRLLMADIEGRQALPARRVPSGMLPLIASS